MIRIKKPRKAPEILRTTGKAKRAALCRAFTKGEREFDFYAAVYGANEVKNALVNAQHSKCCFCESKVGHDGDVEHFRPKSACSQGRRQAMQRPGYYWLAYDWNNLLLCCSPCNSRHKRNYFPLADPKKRARSHRNPIKVEDALFINPAICNPEEFISFREEIPYAINGNVYGKATLEALRLDREIFNERRRDKLAHLKYFRQIIDLEHTQLNTPQGHQLVARAKAFLQQSVKDEAEFAAMCRAAAKEDFYFSK